MTPKSIKIEVRARDHEGFEDRCPCGERNPIANAIRRRLAPSSGTFLATWADRVQVGENCYFLPPEANAADTAFNQHRTVTEFDFRLSNERVPCHPPTTKRKK